ncbi:MAG: signal recognition particle-docking protein FtsY [Microthrixaceae bacterium]
MEILLLVLVVLVVLAGLAFVEVGRRRSRPPEIPTGRPKLGGGKDADGASEGEESGGGTAVLDAPVLDESALDEPVADEAALDEAALDEALVDEPAIDEAALEELLRPSFRDRLGRARSSFTGYIGSVLSRSEINDASYEELEEALILADVGIGPTQELLDGVRAAVAEQKLTTTAELVQTLKDQMKSTLAGPVDLAIADTDPTIWLFVGVNGVGKTTTIGKVGRRLVDEDKTVVMAAGDTFRAAAAEQLQTWAERCGAELIRGAEGGDPSSVIFDAVEAANSRGADVVLADTAGRLHTKTNLMDELSKVRRVADKGAGTVTEVLLVLDATTGQNGLNQARQFAEATDVTGVVLTKLDGSAKGGIVFAIRSELGLPVKLVGLGETAGDLVDFDADEFVDALIDTQGSNETD